MRCNWGTRTGDRDEEDGEEDEERGGLARISSAPTETLRGRLTWMARPARRMLFAVADVTLGVSLLAIVDCETPIRAAPATWIPVVTVSAVMKTGYQQQFHTSFIH